MALNPNFTITDLSKLSPKELVDYKNTLVKKIFEIGFPLNNEETQLFEYLSAQCDIVEALIK